MRCFVAENVGGRCRPQRSVRRTSARAGQKELWDGPFENTSKDGAPLSAGGQKTGAIADTRSWESQDGTRTGCVFRTKGNRRQRSKEKGRDSQRKTRPFPSFDRVARQQSPTDFTAYPGRGPCQALPVRRRSSGIPQPVIRRKRELVKRKEVQGKQESTSGIQGRIPGKWHGTAMP